MTPCASDVVTFISIFVNILTKWSVIFLICVLIFRKPLLGFLTVIKKQIDNVIEVKLGNSFTAKFQHLVTKASTVADEVVAGFNDEFSALEDVVEQELEESLSQNRIPKK